MVGTAAAWAETRLLRKCEDETTARTAIALKEKASAMRLCDVAGNRQAEAETLRETTLVAAALEWLEYASLIGGWYAGTCVGDRDNNRRRLAGFE
jgi:hypothetical protein